MLLPSAHTYTAHPFTFLPFDLLLYASFAVTPLFHLHLIMFSEYMLTLLSIAPPYPLSNSLFSDKTLHTYHVHTLCCISL